jgi:hypothetical protein
MANKSKGPATPSAARQRMMPMWSLMDALLGGTETMRMAGPQYLFQHTGEVDDRYNERLKSATLWNQIELTLSGWVGRPFRDPLKLNDDVPDEIMNLSEDIDQLGTNMDTFARRWFRCGISKAFCHVLIEAPEAAPREDGQPLSIADATEQNIRPYWCLIEPDEVLAARAEIIDGIEILTHLRIQETTMEVDPEDRFNEIMIHRIRVYDRVPVESGPAQVMVTVYRKIEGKDENNIDSWSVEKAPVQIGIDVIPLVTYYADRQGFLLGKSPLQDLADLNLKHWNSQSDQDNILTIARFPILAASGVTNFDGSDPLSSSPQAGQDFRGTKGTVIGPFNVLLSEEPGSKFYYVEHSGKAIASGEKSLKELEAKMAAYGSEFLKKSPDRQTATARALDSLESISPLQATTLNFVDAFQTALLMTAKWMGLDTTGEEGKPRSAGTVTLITDFGPEDASGVDLAALQAMRQARDISGKQMRREAKRRGILADDFDEEENQKELGEEALDLNQTQMPGASIDLTDESDSTQTDEDEDKNEDE